MSNDEKNLGEEGIDLELEPKDENLNGQGDDPLDLLEGEDLRNEAKKFRSISQRKPKVVVEKKAEVVIPKITTDTSDFLKKSDIAKIALQDAKELVSDEIKEHWDDLIAIPLAGYDNLNAKSIAKNMAERLVIFQQRNPTGEKKEDISDLTTTRANGTGSGPSSDKTVKKDPPNFALPKQPKDWYAPPK